MTNHSFATALVRFLLPAEIVFSHSGLVDGSQVARLKKTLVAHPNDCDILEALVSFHHERGEIAEAKKYGAHVPALQPNVTREQ